MIKIENGIAYLDNTTTAEELKDLSRDIKKVSIGNVSETVVHAIPKSVMVFFLSGNANPAAVNALPNNSYDGEMIPYSCGQHMRHYAPIVITAESSIEAISAIPNHFKHAIILERIGKEKLEALAKHHNLGNVTFADDMSLDEQRSMLLDMPSSLYNNVCRSNAKVYCDPSSPETLEKISCLVKQYEKKISLTEGNIDEETQRIDDEINLMFKACDFQFERLEQQVREQYYLLQGNYLLLRNEPLRAIELCLKVEQPDEKISGEAQIIIRSALVMIHDVSKETNLMKDDDEGKSDSSSLQDNVYNKTMEIFMHAMQNSKNTSTFAWEAISFFIENQRPILATYLLNTIIFSKNFSKDDKMNAERVLKLGINVTFKELTINQGMPAKKETPLANSMNQLSTFQLRVQPPNNNQTQPFEDTTKMDIDDEKKSGIVFKK